MPDNALYFPYINVPNSAWFVRVLLYWDKACSIVPYDYINHPERLSSHMRELVTAELVEQISPSQFISLIPNFAEPFLEYIHRRLERQAKFFHTKARPAQALIHIEKLDRVADELRALGLAQRGEYPWFTVDDWVADAFMAYLATLLGKLKEVNAAPVTNKQDSYRLLSNKSPQPLNQPDFGYRRTQSRELILERMLPSPNRIDISELVEFKAQHGKLLNRMRNAIESKCIELANIEDADARRERIDIIVEEINEEVNQIVDAMKSKWKRITFGTLIPILGAGAGIITADQYIAGIATGAALVTAVYEAFKGVNSYQELLRRPLAYAAFARSSVR